jgi:hypothetical protein
MVWWEIVFMLVVLKIPLVYLCLVVWWAIRAEPIPGDGPEPLPVGMPLDEGPRRWWRAKRRRPRPGPHGSAVRGGRTPAHTAAARGRLER